MNTAVGRKSRPARDRTKSAYRPPRRRTDPQAVAWENPPTRKKIGITCRSQVSGCNAGRIARTLVVLTAPSRPTTTTAMSQCPSTTTPSETTRRRSTYRSRVTGVAAAQ